MTEGRPIAVYCGPLDGGSTAKIAVRLANGFAARGISTHLLVSTSRHPIPERIEPVVRIVDIGRMGIWTRIPRMALYLKRNRPAAVLTHRIRENVLTLRAARLSGLMTPVFVTVHGRMSVKLRNMVGGKAKKRRREVLRFYPKNSGIIAISSDTESDVKELLGSDIPVASIPNPIITPEMFESAREPVAHPWFLPDTVPTVIFAGRMEKEKDLFTLLRAFALLRRRAECRLLILGDGSLRPELEAECQLLDLGNNVDIPGWVANPYAYLSRADLVVLSSTWDALPTILIEALALGTPVVSTDCGAGPREILQNGRLGPLVPPGNPSALSEAMYETLANPLPRDALREGGHRYDAQQNADRYLEFMSGRRQAKGTKER